MFAIIAKNPRGNWGCIEVIATVDIYQSVIFNPSNNIRNTKSIIIKELCLHSCFHIKGYHKRRSVYPVITHITLFFVCLFFIVVTVFTKSASSIRCSAIQYHQKQQQTCFIHRYFLYCFIVVSKMYFIVLFYCAMKISILSLFFVSFSCK